MCIRFRDTHSCDNQLNHNEVKRWLWRRGNNRAANLAHFRPALSDKATLVRSPACFSTFPLPPPRRRRLHLPYLSPENQLQTCTRFRGIEIIRATRRFNGRKKRGKEKKNKRESEMQIPFSPEIPRKRGAATPGAENAT